MRDRDSFTPISPLASRLALERALHDIEAQGETIGSMAAQIAQTHDLTVKTATAVAELGVRFEALEGSFAKRAPMSPAAIKAWGAAAVLVLGALQTLVTTYRMSEAQAAAKQQAAEVTRQERLRSGELVNERAIARAVELQAERDRITWEGRLAAQKAELERQASMRRK